MNTVKWSVNFCDLPRAGTLDHKNFEVIFRIHGLSTRSEISIEESLNEMNKLLVLGAKSFIIDIDLILTQSSFDYLTQGPLELILRQSDQAKLPLSLRVKDFGLAYFASRSKSHIPLQLNLESGHHNWRSIEEWIRSLAIGTCGPNQLERIILSPELPGEWLKKYCFNIDSLAKELKRGPIQKEILTAGPILLFTSPRKLLSAVIEEYQATNLTAVVDSQESPHHGFIAYENAQGTVLFHPKRLNLLSEDIGALGITHQRIEWKLPGSQQQESESQAQARKEFFQLGKILADHYPYPSIPGFFHSNRSQVLFSKLKNKNLNRSEAELLESQKMVIGHIVDVIKSEGLILFVEANVGIKMGDNLEIINPEGLSVSLVLEKLQNLDGEEKEFIGQGELAFIPYVRKMVSQSIVLKEL